MADHEVVSWEANHINDYPPRGGPGAALVAIEWMSYNKDGTAVVFPQDSDVKVYTEFENGEIRTRLEFSASLVEAFKRAPR